MGGPVENGPGPGLRWDGMCKGFMKAWAGCETAQLPDPQAAAVVADEKLKICSQFHNLMPLSKYSSDFVLWTG